MQKMRVAFLTEDRWCLHSAVMQLYGLLMNQPDGRGKVDFSSRDGYTGLNEVRGQCVIEYIPVNRLIASPALIRSGAYQFDQLLIVQPVGNAKYKLSDKTKRGIDALLEYCIWPYSCVPENFIAQEVLIP